MKKPINTGRRRRGWPGFTLVELLVVIAIIGILVALLLPAVQAARQAARRMSSENNLRQLAIALHNFHDTNKAFPAGANFPSPPNPRTTYGTWIIPILPFIEQMPLYDAWYADTSAAARYNGPDAPAAAVIPTLIAPADALGMTPHEQMAPGVNPNFPLGRYVGLTSYGCNGGTQAPLAHVHDGVFHYSVPVRIADITDGTSNTLLIGERYGFDRHWDALTRRGSNDMRAYSSWSGGPFFAWRTSQSPINYRLPDYVGTSPPEPFSPEYFDLYYRRLFALGSASSAGASVAFSDGSVRFLTASIDLLTLRELSTRASGNVVPGEW